MLLHSGKLVKNLFRFLTSLLLSFIIGDRDTPTGIEKCWEVEPCDNVWIQKICTAA